VPKRLEGERGTFSSMCVRGSTGVRVSRLLCSGASPFAGIARREWRPTGSFGAVVQPRIALPLHCLLPFAFDVVSCHVCIVPSLPMEPPPLRTTRCCGQVVVPYDYFLPLAGAGA